MAEIKQETINGSDLSGSSGATGRTYSLTYSNSTDEFFTIMVDGSALQLDIQYTKSGDTITFLVAVFDSQPIVLDYFANDSYSADVVAIADSVHNRVDNIPTYYSGTGMKNNIEYTIYNLNADNSLDVNINISGIENKYKSPLIKLEQSATLRVVDIEGTDSSSTKLGEFTIKKGGQSSAQTNADRYEQDAMTSLMNLKNIYGFSKALG